MTNSLLPEIRETDTSSSSSDSKLPIRESGTMPRVKSFPTQLGLDNVVEGETIYQRCVLISGHCQVSGNDEDFITISSPSFPTQTWPVSAGRFKALVILSPGPNKLMVQHSPPQTSTGLKRKHIADEEELTLTLTYVPLLQTPPLHLAIMIAKDSPLIIDCPPSKRGGLTSAHSDLDAAIKKFRMTAYMWQALTAEDMRSKGLARRSFRLEEEWTTDTLSSTFFNSSLNSSNGSSHVGLKSSVRSTAKIHLIRSDKTVAELRDAKVAQQNPRVGEKRKQNLHKWFTAALKAAGGPFTDSARPVVAGLILDSHYDIENDLITAHAALGNSNPKGISLGMCGSHLTYSWPRFIEEVSACLLDTSEPGETVGNDNGECGTLWEACAIGQGAFLHEVGHAFGADHTESPIGRMKDDADYPNGNIMQRGYAQHWPKNFLPQTAYCSAKKSEGSFVEDGHGDSKMVNPARWDLKDAVNFSLQPHFWIPEDKVLDVTSRSASPSIVLIKEDDSEDYSLEIECAAGIARVSYSGFCDDDCVSVQNAPIKLGIKKGWLGRKASDEDYSELVIRVLGMNGKEKTFKLRQLLKNRSSHLLIPGTKIRLGRCSAIDDDAAGERKPYWEWAVLFNEMKNGNLTRANKIDTRVGCILDGAVVYFDDGHSVNCGIRHRNGHPHHFGGHASEAIQIPNGVEVVKLEIGKQHSQLVGMRVYLSNGAAAGELNKNDYGDGHETEILEPPPNHKIIGFYGQSDQHGFGQAREFGIITAPCDVELPAQLYRMTELQNTDGGLDSPKNTAENENIGCGNEKDWSDGDGSEVEEYEVDEDEEDEEDDDDVSEDEGDDEIDESATEKSLQWEDE